LALSGSGSKTLEDKKERLLETGDQRNFKTTSNEILLLGASAVNSRSCCYTYFLPVPIFESLLQVI